MKLLYFVLAIALAALAGWVGRGALQVPSGLEEEIAANEAICADETPKGYASYPITRNGQIRGCLRVREGTRDWTLPKQMFVRKEPW
jgi:hypothetical protein